MKKFTIIVLVIVLLLIGGCASGPLINDFTAYQVERTLCETPLPPKTELVDSLSKAGKLTGNGNGMQYLGAILIRSELNMDELNAYYSDYRKTDWDYLVKTQQEMVIEIGNRSLQFSVVAEGPDYYIVYTWGSGIALFAEMDLRGH